MAKSINDLPAPIQGLGLAALAAILAGLVFYFYVYPLNDQNATLQKQVTALKADNDKNEAFKQQQTEYVNRIKQLEGQLDTLRSIVPDNQDTDEFMKTVFADGEGTGTQIRTFIPGVPVAKENFMEMPFAVRLDGTYYSLVNFFDRLSHEQRIMSVSGLSLGGPEGGGMGAYKVSSSETVGANCVLTTYYNKPLTAAPPPKKKP
jgi:type IV pilus assembly protein PilO